MKLEWSDKYKIGIDSIDSQHKWLIEAISNLQEAILNKDKSKTSDILIGLVDYTMNHFIFEETIFEQIGYNETPAHKAEHVKFTEKIITVLGDYKDGNELSSDIIPFLNDWLLHHILKVDLAYVPTLKAHGIK